MAPVATRNTILVAAAGALVLAAIAPVLIPLAFGDAYEDSIEPLWLLLPGTVALCGSKVLTSYIFSQGRPLVNTGITIVSLVVTVVAQTSCSSRGSASTARRSPRRWRTARTSRPRSSPTAASPGARRCVALIPDRDDVGLYRDALAQLRLRNCPEGTEPSPIGRAGA